MRNVDELVDEAKWGKLTKEEMQYVVSQISESKPDDGKDLYGLLYILGRSISADPLVVRHRKLVEKFLVYPSDPMVSRIAFKVVCDYWGFTKDYLSQMKEFIRGVDWDADNDVRLVAVSSAGEYLRSTFDRELLELLIETFEGSRCSSRAELESDNVVREAAYSALARADGWCWREVPPANVDLIKLLEDGELNLSPVEHAKEKIYK